MKALLAAAGLLISGILPAANAATSSPSPWNGSWQLSLPRSSAAAKEGAPGVYRFRLGNDGEIVWEIPELGEVVTGRTDGTPMPIRRTEAAPGLTLAVKAVGPRELTYEVARDGRVMGGGRMMLVDDASAWVDLTWGKEGPGYGAELVYDKLDQR
ncbi:MAG: hypothetical protein ACRYG6_03435 [Janthinobacterium lividum]